MKSEIIARLNELAHQDKVLDSINEYNDLVNEFYRIQNEEERQWEIKKLERIEAGEKPEAIEKPTYELLEEFKKITTLYRDKKKIEVDALKEIEKANLDKKKALVAALADLIQNEENIGRAIARFKDIQDSWKEVGAVPRDKRQDLQNEFSNLVESFRYNINIYKEIKDHDLNRNLKLKKDLIENLKKLTDLEHIKEVEEKLHAYQDEWNNIGGTHQQDWEKIKGEYWETVNGIYEKIHKFYRGRKEERAENLEKKKALVEKAKEIVSREIATHKAWKKQTDSLIALQEEWKTIGFGPKEENNAIWKEFRGICNDFFAKKKEFYGERNSQFDGVKEKKEALIKEVEGIKDSTDWKNTTKQIMDIQKRWKEVGSAGPKHENRLWKEFRAHIDHFFNSKDGHFKKADQSYKENLSAKEALIKKVQEYKMDGDGKKAINDLKEFSAQFAGIGNVPFKEKDRIYKAFKTALDEKYAAVDMDATEKEKMMFEAKLESIRNSHDPENMIDRERGFIRKKIGKLNDEINKFETNMSFFSNADESNPLFKSVMENLTQTKSELEGLKVQLKLLRQLENELEEDEEEVVEETEAVESTEGENSTEEESTNE